MWSPAQTPHIEGLVSIAPDCQTPACRRSGCMGRRYDRKALRDRINERFSETLKYLAESEAKDGRCLIAEEIEAARTPAGEGTRAQLASWGVPWPPPKGWKYRLKSGSQRGAPLSHWHDEPK